MGRARRLTRALHLQMWAHLGGADAPPMPTLTANPFAATTVDIGRTDSSFVDSFEDDLTMAIATKSWNEAVELVGKGEHLGAPTRWVPLIPKSQAKSTSVRPEPRRWRTRP